MVQLIGAIIGRMKSCQSRPISRRTIQILLGLLWLIDAGLQLQPKMFTRQFARLVLVPAASGQPTFIRAPMTLAIHLDSLHPALWNSLFIVIQFVIGALILYRRSVKVGLGLSIVWALTVWFLGEGLGGLAAGQAMLLMGAPGAAALYAVLALGVWPAQAAETNQPAAWLTIIWALIWVGGALLLLHNAGNANTLATMVSSGTAGAPHWLKLVDGQAAKAVRLAGDPVIWLLAALEVLSGLLIFAPHRWRSLAIGLGCALAVVFWFVGQGAGGLTSGLATDLNTSPLLVLLGIAIVNSPDHLAISNWI